MASSERARSAKRRAAVVLVQVGLTSAAVLLLASFWRDDGERAERLVWTLSLAYTAHALWAFWSWHLLTRRWVDAYSLFLLSLLLFSGGQLLLHALGLLDAPLELQFRAATIRRTVLLVNASVAAFHLGAVLRAAAQRPEAAGSRPGQPAACDAGVLRWIGYLFLGAALPLTAIDTFRSIQIVASSGYLALYQQQAHTGIGNWDAVVASFFIPGLLIVLATRPDRPLNVWLCWLLAIGAIGTNLFYGARAAAAIAFLPILMVQDLLVRRIRPAVAVAVGVGGLVAIPIIGSLREMDLRDRVLATQTGAVLETAAPTAAVQEMGGSMGTVAHTIELVPAQRPFDGGMGYARAATTVFPNVLWDVHPAVRHGTYSQWLIREVDPVVSEAGGGLGFSMIAEAYLNARWWGAPLVMLLAGFLLSAFVGWTRRGGDAVRYTLEALVLSAVLVLPRSESGAILRPIVWMALLPYLVARHVPRRRTQPSTPRASGIEDHDDVEHVRRCGRESTTDTCT